VTDRLARIVLGVACGLVLLLAATVDLPQLAGGRFWSDAATYHAMAGSLAFDHDLEFRAEDLRRTREAWSEGPQGVFLKRVGGGDRLYYAKALLYPVVAAPLVRLLGVDRGLLLVNGLVFAGVLGLGFAELRRRAGPLPALGGVVALFLAGVGPVYLTWETPEIFNLGLVTFGLVAGLRGRPTLSAVLLGLATYAKPTNAALALPLLLDPLLGARLAGWRRAGETLRRAGVVAAAAAVGFAATALATGEANYQGGERKTFYDRFPGDPGTTFDSAGIFMSTEHVGPLVAGRDDVPDTRTAPPRSASELRQSFRLNLGYFWVGRFAGAGPYYPGFAASLLLFLILGPRTRAGGLALVSLAVSCVGYLLLIPDNWYGGAGTIGNRYFLNLLPLGLLLLPARRGTWAAALGLAVSVPLLGPMLASPVRHSLSPGAHATGAAFRVLPAELTMLGDLSVFTDVWRKRRPYNAPGGDPSRHPPGSPPPYFLWFLDDGTYGQESSFEREGFWLRGGRNAEVVLQTLSPLRRLRVDVTAGPAGDVVTARLGRDRQRLVLPALRRRPLVYESPGPSVGYYGTHLYRLQLASRLGAGADGDRRDLGSFVYLVPEEER
jgi:hypothetical protein